MGDEEGERKGGMNDEEEGGVDMEYGGMKRKKAWRDRHEHEEGE